MIFYQHLKGQTNHYVYSVCTRSMCLFFQKLFSIQIYYRDNLSVIWVYYVFIPNIEDVNTA